MQLYQPLNETVKKAKSLPIEGSRKEVLQVLIAYIQEKVDSGSDVNLNFICTHNSRRSQFSQIWAQTAADYFNIPVNCYSGGVEVTAFNERAVDSVKRSGFQVNKDGDDNPRYMIRHSASAKPILAFSKLFDDSINKVERFAAVMTCSHADENCPFIPGTEQRIPVRYKDPKKYDDTSEEQARYDERSLQIASEMFHVFSQIKL
ncbi:protein-tyrosine-phosphatase [Algoriphagus halophytocola]|uniref:Protein-tyrosine-phosphatase n=1 Tax=Algoriphagus halophytocola TaxID=2991499 RepID=A0ABY6MHM3_9BACT|nr:MULTISPECIES: protein-tyrosine-phosphatase [unclassified Algoriphagus]UZD23292.1 protein-tyrosine-phosphatase [Algoriphagus sp. TR-M5]WBL44586.1 protein-tyrosine-phosphatase [Algoriphagus sp. TR-M9]